MLKLAIIWNQILFVPLYGLIDYNHLLTTTKLFYLKSDKPIIWASTQIIIRLLDQISTYTSSSAYRVFQTITTSYMSTSCPKSRLPNSNFTFHQLSSSSRFSDPTSSSCFLFSCSPNKQALTREKSSFLCWTNTKPQKGNNTISKLGTAPVEHTWLLA